MKNSSIVWINNIQYRENEKKKAGNRWMVQDQCWLKNSSMEWPNDRTYGEKKKKGKNWWNGKGSILIIAGQQENIKGLKRKEKSKAWQKIEW